MSELFKQLGINWMLILAQLFNFAVLVFVLTKFIYKPLINLLEDRKKKISEDLEKSKILDNKIKEAQKAKEEMLIEARQESEKLIKNSEKNAKDIKESVIKETSEEVAKLKDEAKKQILRDKEKVAEDIKKEMGRLIAISIEKTVGDVMESNTQRKLVDEAVRNIR